MRNKILVLVSLCCLLLCSCGMDQNNVTNTGRESSSVNPEIPEDTEQVKTSTFQQIQKTYCYEGEETDIEKIAVMLYRQMAEDTMTADDARTFQITEYKDLEVFVAGVEQEEPGRPWAGRVDENRWYTTAEMQAKHTGLISPLGPHDEDAFYEIDLGEWYIQRTDGVYFLFNISVLSSLDAERWNEEKIYTFQQIEKTYSYEGEENDIEKIAVILYQQLLEDTMSADDLRDFQIIEYKNLEVFSVGTDQDAPQRIWSGKLNENTWYTEARVDIKYTGGDALICYQPYDENQFYTIFLYDWYIQRVDDVYSLINITVLMSQDELVIQ